MIIVGLTGEIESGKTTFADFLAEQSSASDHWESWQVIAEIASGLRSSGLSYPTPESIDCINAWLQPLPDIVKLAVHRDITYDDLRLTPERIEQFPAHYEKLFLHLNQTLANPELKLTAIDAENKELFRPLLQWLGGYLVVKSDEGLWYDEILRRIAKRTDLDLATIGGVRFPGESERIRAAGGKVLRIVRPNRAKRDANDLTEQQGSQVVVSSTVHNDGTLVQLRACSTSILHDLQAGKLDEIYRATTS